MEAEKNKAVDAVLQAESQRSFALLNNLYYDVLGKTRSKISRERFLKRAMIPYMVQSQKLRVSCEQFINNGDRRVVSEQLIDKIAGREILKQSLSYPASNLQFWNRWLMGKMSLPYSKDNFAVYYSSFQLAQKLAYLYGIDNIWYDEDAYSDDKKLLINCLIAVMYNVEGAREVLKALLECLQPANSTGLLSLSRGQIKLPSDQIQLVMLGIERMLLNYDYFTKISRTIINVAYQSPHMRMSSTFVAQQKGYRKYLRGCLKKGCRMSSEKAIY